ncbi:MAG TPA: DUF5711 family protein [Ruminiclostridium sp.]
MRTGSKFQSNVVEIKKLNSSLVGIVTFLLLIIAISIVAFVVYLKSFGYDFSTWSIRDAIAFISSQNEKAGSSTTSKIAFSQDGSVDCKLYKNYTIVLSKDGIKWYDKNSKLLQEKALTLTRPVLRSSDEYMAVVDISGRDIYFYKDKAQLWTRKLDNQIINADISDDGYCTVVTQSEEYKSTVQVIDLNGVDKYTKLCAEDIVLGAKVIHKGQDVLINKVVTDSIKTGTQFEFNNIYDEKPFATVNIADSIFPILISHGENEIAVGQNVVLFMDKQGKEVWRKKADSIFCIAPNSEKYVIIAGEFTSSTGITKQQVLVLNAKGEEVYRFDQPENIIGMDLNGDRLALRTQRSVYLYTLKGKKLGQYSASNEIKDAFLVGNNEAIVISGGTISLVKIQG